MRILLCTTFAVVLTVPNASAQNSDDCRHEAERAANVDVGGARLLELDAGSGSLKIVGKTGLNRVVIRGRACASDEDLLDDIKLEARRDGNSIVVRANVRDDNNFSFRGREYARLDVVMEVPAGMAANIDDGSGSIELSHLGAVDLDDGSGEIIADDIASIRIDDGSGEIELDGVHGRVDIKDGSGEITLRNVEGAVEIDDGSGEINVRVAKSSIRISDSSGSISVVDVSGDFVVEEDGSGGIDYDNVRGRVDIPRKKR
jgi:DUF4097 and DUF4098 domain-containing protein YvlB